MTKVNANRKGFVLILVAMSLALLMGAMGLAIDAAVMYTVRAKLSAACDGASLAAARNLNVGMTMDAQKAAAEARAKSFYEGNYPSRYMGSVRNPPDIDVPINVSSNILTVTTTGSATVGTFFMRYFGTKDVRIEATGTASRRNVNLMMVIDRSGSMNWSRPVRTSCEEIKIQAPAFANKFVEGRDKVGLLTFSLDVVLHQPPKTTFKSVVASKMAALDCETATSLTQAYVTGYQELAKLHEPSSLNVLLLFTDGNPNGIIADFPMNAGCNGGRPLRGSLTRAGINAKTTDPDAGLYQYLDTGTHKDYTRIAGGSGCEFKDRGPNYIKDDILGIPNLDIWGNQLWGYTNQYVDVSPYLNDGRVIASNSYAHFLAGKNELDHAAMRGRDRTLPGSDSNVGIVTYVIGLGNPAYPYVNEQPDDDLLRRVANAPPTSDEPNAAFVHRDDVPDGMYIRANDGAGMAEAFMRIASEVLRLSH